MKRHLLLVALCVIVFRPLARAQTGSVGINTATPDASAALDISSNNKGLLIPRVTTAQRTGISSPAQGLMVYDTDLNQFWFYNGSLWTVLNGAGSPGATGATGPTGADGTNGNDGATGPTGAQGVTGTDGSNGTNGATWFTGSGAPSGGAGAVNDLYINTTNGDYYKKTGTSTWTLQANLTGAAGAAGATGPTGPSITCKSVMLQSPLTPYSGSTYEDVTGNTVGFTEAVDLPFNITVNKLTFWVYTGGVITAGTVKIGIYSEDGQTQLLSLTTATISSAGSVTTTLGSSLTLSAGRYYFVMVPVSTTYIYGRAFQVESTTPGFPAPAGKPIWIGKQTVTAGTLPGTFTPSSLTTGAVYFIQYRLDN